MIRWSPVRLGALLAVVALNLFSLSPLASAQTRASLPDIEDEVMCPICGTLLELSDSPQAQREKAFIRHLIVQGKTKSQVEDALVAQYGESVLANPPASGFDLSAYVVPALALLAIAIAIGFGVWRWRGTGRRGPPGGSAGDAPGGEDEKRLDADLARYDL
jgi:cytochrome c-type biogenesis protein CcmH/NrfF